MNFFKIVSIEIKVYKSKLAVSRFYDNQAIILVIENNFTIMIGMFVYLNEFQTYIYTYILRKSKGYWQHKGGD